ncbi:MAG TPA: sigma 54-interacting transcriptional regulator [Candidatus Binatia bacterium]|nr:sigma 54-interacting transcriptional regulator [Candidatus Binatia bacterium]
MTTITRQHDEALFNFRSLELPGIDVSNHDYQRQPAPEDAVLRAIVEGVEAETGDGFFAVLTRHLASAFNVQYAFVSEITPDRQSFRTLALWGQGALRENLIIGITGTPCEAVLSGQAAHHSENLQALFPKDKGLVDWGAVSYAGVPLLDRYGLVIGHLAIVDDKPMWGGLRSLSIMRIFAARACAEIARLRAEQDLFESERRFRDLYDEAPIAYVYEDTESRFISANRAAMKLLGLKPEEVRGTLGLSLVASTTETQERVHRALEAVQKGEERASIELELRRKDDGRPVWVQWWSKPEPNGKYTRTMLIDVTDRVLAEQERNRLQQQNAYLREEIKSEYNFEEIIGDSSALRSALDKVGQVASTDVTVLIQGETGTGKELIARAIHDLSPRRERPLVKVNCGAISAGLVESELFGHEKGAFTGALQQRIGRFEVANHGTIFLDEVGELPPDVQVKLLRVLQEQEFERVGSSKTLRVDVRVIAATNRDLREEVKAGRFRMDLYYRLNVVPLNVPPLRERVTDIPLLVEHLLRKAALRLGKRFVGTSPETMHRLVRYRWPGNVRELENVIERAAILTNGTMIEIDDLPKSDQTETIGSRDAVTLEDVERSHILSVLKKTRWYISGERGAAVILGLNPSTLRSRMQKLGIRRPALEY